jgi:RNA polymerase sigma-70 factor (ECF subfamily)
MVGETSNTWLQSLKRDGPHADGWRRLVESYGPFIRGILLHRGTDEASADDIVQNVMTVVVRRLPEFERQRIGSFRTWLRSITANCLREYCAAGKKHAMAAQVVQPLAQALEDPRSQLTRLWDRQHAKHVVDTLLAEIAVDFKPETIEVFRRLAIDEQPVDDVAMSLGISANACFIARSRVLKRLRERLHELIGKDAGVFELLD